MVWILWPLPPFSSPQFAQPRKNILSFLLVAVVTSSLLAVARSKPAKPVPQLPMHCIRLSTPSSMSWRKPWFPRSTAVGRYLGICNNGIGKISRMPGIPPPPPPLAVPKMGSRRRSFGSYRRDNVPVTLRASLELGSMRSRYGGGGGGGGGEGGDSHRRYINTEGSSDQSKAKEGERKLGKESSRNAAREDVEFEHIKALSGDAALKTSADPLFVFPPEITDPYAFLEAEKDRGNEVLKKISREHRLSKPQFELQIPVYMIQNEKDEVAAMDIIDDMINSCDFLGMDTESAQFLANEKSKAPSIVQIASDKAVVLWNLRKFGKPPSTLRAVLEADTPKVCHDETGDTHPLYTNWGIDSRHVLDTLQLARAISSENLSLADLCAAFIDRSLSKKLQKSNWNREVLSRSQIVYAAKDAIATLLIYRAMAAHARRRGIDVPPVAMRPTSERLLLDAERKKVPQMLQKLNEYLDPKMDIKRKHPLAAARDKWEAVIRMLEGRESWPEEVLKQPQAETLAYAIEMVQERLASSETPSSLLAIAEHDARNEAKAKLHTLAEAVREAIEFPKGYPSSARALKALLSIRAMILQIDGGSGEREAQDSMLLMKMMNKGATVNAEKASAHQAVASNHTIQDLVESLQTLDLKSLRPLPPTLPQATTTTTTATATTTAAATSTAASIGLSLPSSPSSSSSLTFFSEVRGLDPLVRKEVRAQIEKKKLPKLFKRVDIDLQEYRKRDMTAMARGILHEMRQRFAKSAKSSKSASAPVPSTKSLVSSRSKNYRSSGGGGGGGGSKKIAPEEHQRQNNEKMREWVVQQMSRKDRGPYWEDEEFCKVALKLTSTGAADDNEDVHEQLLKAQRECRGGGGGQHEMVVAEATAATSSTPIDAETKKTRKRRNKRKSGSKSDNTSTSSNSSSSRRRRRRRREVGVGDNL
mmetsp:Transcript_30211/g.42178  ORF Transcript_30211/g.42178 Transcript_30211/m.42178 type:complete len:930 (-) Transcript_30211:962-3751(-)